ncbi:hypothetical protein [Cohnella sp. GCM10012308]|uniref:hypothetical protein n=1 Tax=Cohnella sp. GCM10012308 TaxID=3317329 RepID=UPI0036168AAB
MPWIILDPVGGTYNGEITPLTSVDYKYLRPIRIHEKDGWFDWHEYVKNHPLMKVYKLRRKGKREILGVIALNYRDGVFVDSLETSLHSRHMPTDQKQYVNLADIMISFAALWGLHHYKDDFVGLIPKDNKREYYKHKFGARPMGAVYALNPVVITRMIGLYYLEGDDSYA